MIKISFIIPVYNAEQYLQRAISSVLSLESQEIELILVNDGSKDQSLKICEQFAKEDERVKLFDQENMGVSVARNTGIKYATGKYLFFLDADDFLTNQKNILEIINSENDYDIIGYNHICLYENNYEKEEYYSEKYEQEGEMEYLNRQLLTTHMLHTCWGKLYKKDIIDQYDVAFPVGVSVGEDYMFVLEYCRYIKSGILINMPVLYYFINSKSVMQNFNYEARYNTWRDLMDYTEDYYHKCGYKFNQDFYLYQFKTFTSMSRNIFISCSNKEINDYILKIKNDSSIKYIISKLNQDQLSIIKKIETFLIKNRHWELFKCYFNLKALIQKLRRGI